MFYCDACKNFKNSNTKSSQINSKTHIEKENIPRINKNFTDKKQNISIQNLIK